MKGRNLHITLFSLGSALLFTYFLLWVFPGINVFIYWLLITLSTFLYLRTTEPKLALKRSIPIFIAILPIAAVSIYRTNYFYIFLTFMLLPFLFYIFVSLDLKELKKIGVIQIILLPLTIFLSWFIDLIRFYKGLSRDNVKKTLKSESTKQYVVGLLAALPFFVIFILLFSSADAFFNQYLQDLFNDWDISGFLEKILDDEETFKLIFNMTFTLVASVYFLAVYNATFKGRSGIKEINRKFNKQLSKIRSNWSEKMLGIFLLPLNILFGLFVWFQIEYLFGGEQNITGDLGLSMTYSEYARRGFVELLIASFIVFLIVWTLQSKVDLKKSFNTLWYKINGIIFLLFTLVISISALSRMQLLTEAYGFTNIRLFGLVVMVCITLLIPVVIYAVYSERKFLWFNKAYAYFALAGLLFLIFAPTDLIVARQNIARYEETGQLDIKYLFTLTVEAQNDVSAFLTSDAVDDEINAATDYIYSEVYDLNKERDWKIREYNVSRAVFNNFLEERYSGKDEISDKYINSIEGFLGKYSNVLKSGDYQKAFDDFWSDSSDIYDLDELESMTVVDMKIAEIEDLENVIGESMNITAGVPFQDFLFVPYELTIEYRSKRYICNNAMVLSLHGDGYRIESDSNLILGYPSYYYYEPTVYDLEQIKEGVPYNLETHCEVVEN